MCLISFAVFMGFFGRYPEKHNNPESKMGEKIMGPRFIDLCNSTANSQKTFCNLPREELTITADDGVKLVAYYFKNEVETDNTAVLVHGYNSTGFTDFATVGLQYLKRGFNVLLVTNRACGDSEGFWTGFGVLESVDTAKWVDLLVERNPNAKIVLEGCSLGGATVCTMSDMDLPKNVKAIVSDCAFDDAGEEMKHMAKYMAHLPSFPLLNLVHWYCKHLAHYDFSARTPISAVKNSKLPIFFVHGKDDRFIPCAAAQRLYDACPTDKELVFVDGAGHAAAHFRGGEENFYKPVFAFIDKHLAD